MEQRKRLAQLLNQKRGAFHELFGIECGAIADHLLANGVIVLPDKLGTKVYCLAQPCGGCPGNNENLTVELIEQCKKCNRWEVIYCDFDYELIPEWGKYVFATKEEAEQALKEKMA